MTLLSILPFTSCFIMPIPLSFEATQSNIAFFLRWNIMNADVVVVWWWWTEDERNADKQKRRRENEKLFLVVERACLPLSSLNTHDLRAKN